MSSTRKLIVIACIAAVFLTVVIAVPVDVSPFVPDLTVAALTNDESPIGISFAWIPAPSPRAPPV